MTYCTKADLIARGWEEELISLTDKAGLLGGIIDDVALAQAISDTSAEIDSYLVGHIALPLTNPSDFLVRKACDMVRFYLYDIGAIEPVTKRYEAAIGFLKGVSEGTTMLSALMTTPLASNLIQKPVVKAAATFFTESLLEKM
ncbi:MAG: DUF1320 domain-containing protein [Methylococcaceae bacterium]